MEMPAGDQQGRGQSVLSLGLSVWGDQLNHVVALVGTIHGFVSLSLFSTNLDKQSLPGRKNVALGAYHGLLLCVVGTNNHLVDSLPKSCKLQFG